MRIVYKHNRLAIHDVVGAQITGYHHAMTRQIPAAAVDDIILLWENHQGLVLCQIKPLENPSDFLRLRLSHIEGLKHLDRTFLRFVAQRTPTSQFLYFQVDALGVIPGLRTENPTTAPEQWVLDATRTRAPCSLLLLQFAGRS